MYDGASTAKILADVLDLDEDSVSLSDAIDVEHKLFKSLTDKLDRYRRTYVTRTAYDTVLTELRITKAQLPRWTEIDMFDNSTLPEPDKAVILVRDGEYTIGRLHQLGSLKIWRSVETTHAERLDAFEKWMYVYPR